MQKSCLSHVTLHIGQVFVLADRIPPSLKGSIAEPHLVQYCPSISTDAKAKAGTRIEMQRINEMIDSLFLFILTLLKK